MAVTPESADGLLDVKGLAAPTCSGEEATWYERCRARLLSFHRCTDCSSAIFPPRSVCPVCGSMELVWSDSAGAGVVYSYTVQRRAARARMPEASVIVLVDLDEGFRMLSRLECDPDLVSVGMQVRVGFAAAGDFVVPVFVAA